MEEMQEKLECEEEEYIVFAQAKEFLRIVQAKNSIPKEKISTSTENQSEDDKRKTVQFFGVHKRKKPQMVRSDSISLTPLQRKKLERVKTPVTSFRKPQTQNGLSEKEKEESVRKMLEYIRRMPEQETYTPPQFPMVSISDQTLYEEASFISEKSTVDHGDEFTFLTSEQELTTWKLLRSSPKNCNIFVGNLSYRVDEALLLAAFQSFIVEKQQNLLKVRIVTDPLLGASKGYGFVQFPYRRAAELAIICMQGFEIYGREIQLGWGQEVTTNVLQPGKDKVGSLKKIGLVISDSFCGSKSNQSGRKKREKTRWDVEWSAKSSTEELLSTKMNKPGKNNGFVNSTDCISFKVHLPDVDLHVMKKENTMPSGTEFHTTENEVNKEDVLSYPSGKLSFGRETTAKSDHTKKLNTKFPAVTEVLVEESTSSVSQSLSLEHEANVVERKTSSDKPIEWLTRGQRAKMIEVVCRTLRKKGVKDHIGVFGTHFESDNSRLFAVFCKKLGEEDLKCEFEKYGEVDIKINKDTCGSSRGSAIVQYVTSASAENALKQLHGKVLGSKPLTIKVAEPKRTQSKVGKS